MKMLFYYAFLVLLFFAACFPRLAAYKKPPTGVEGFRALNDSPTVQGYNNHQGTMRVAYLVDQSLPDYTAIFEPHRAIFLRI